MGLDEMSCTLHSQLNMYRQSAQKGYFPFYSNMSTFLPLKCPFHLLNCLLNTPKYPSTMCVCACVCACVRACVCVCSFIVSLSLASLGGHFSWCVNCGCGQVIFTWGFFCHYFGPFLTKTYFEFLVAIKNLLVTFFQQ